nr:SCY1-like protein 2 isoform X2 [Dermatophagoides farinae]
MFSKLKSSSSSPNSASPTLSTNSFGGSGSGCNNIDVNPISQYYECGKQIGSAGPELVWKIFDAVRKTDMKDASLFFYDKRTADKLHKPKRKEMIAEILRFSVRQLDRFRHPRILAIMHPVEESSDTLAFATEPILGSLANCYEYLEERLPQSYEPLPLLRESNLLDFEIKYGLLQIVEALIHLHHNCKVIHRNISPQSILINKKGTWKLAGFEFVEKCNDNDIMNVIPCQPYTSKLPKMGQPDLDFTAPEVQTQSLCTPNSDMFSLGLLITFLYNNGRSLITANLNASNYLKQLDSLNVSLNQLLPNIPSGLHESLKSLLEIDYKKRPISQNLTTKLWYQHILPSMVCELESPEVLAAALQPIIHMINRSTLEQFQEFILPFIKNIFQMPKSVQATVTLLENIDILMLKTCTSDFFRTEIVPMICNAFDSSTPQIQSAAMSALSQVIDHLDEVTIRRMILPKTKQLFDINADVKIQINILICIEKVIGNLDKSDILDDVLPMIMRARIQDVSVLIIVINICKLMMMDTKKYGITVNILAMKIMPALVPALANVNLNIDEFNDLVSLLNEMLTYVAKTQRNKLVLEKNNNVTVTTIKIPEITESLRESNTTLNNINSLGSYPHRPPSLRLESRRTSISMDDVVRRASLTSAASSPDSNLLRVQAHLPGRRHSDNTILPPRILVAPSTPTTSFSLSRGPSTSNLNARRHSSIVGLKEMKDSKNFIPNIPKISHNISNNLGIESFLSSRSSGRRYSAVPTFDKLNFSSSSSSSHHHKNTSTNLLQTIGTGVQQLFK